MIDSLLRQGIALLRDEQLVWSEDLELLRLPLADLLDKINQLPTHQLDEELEVLLGVLLRPDLVEGRVPEPLERWMRDAARQLGVYKVAANESPAMRDIVRKLFKSL